MRNVLIGAVIFLVAVVLFGSVGSYHDWRVVLETTTPDENVTLIFASGCFWARQRGMVAFEQAHLARGNASITSVAGYIGGDAAGVHGEVCHYNAGHSAEYASLGYAEAVQVTVPVGAVSAAVRLLLNWLYSIGFSAG